MLIFPKVYSQIDFQSDTNKTPIYPNLANQIDNSYPKFDFQFRFWVDGPLLRLSKKRIIIMTLTDTKWICDLYKIVYSLKNNTLVIKKYSQIENCDSIWNYFIQNHIFELPTMDSLMLKFKAITNDRKGDRIIIADGLNYSLEFLSKNKYKRLEYHCPITYKNEYPEIPELSNISNIVKRLFILAKIKFEPC
jgi:hypothetical protein